jgi:hypothetical protein
MLKPPAFACPCPATSTAPSSSRTPIDHVGFSLVHANPNSCIFNPASLTQASNPRLPGAYGPKCGNDFSQCGIVSPGKTQTPTVYVSISMAERTRVSRAGKLMRSSGKKRNLSSHHWKGKIADTIAHVCIPWDRDHQKLWNLRRICKRYLFLLSPWMEAMDETCLLQSRLWLTSY